MIIINIDIDWFEKICVCGFLKKVDRGYGYMNWIKEWLFYCKWYEWNVLRNLEKIMEYL